MPFAVSEAGDLGRCAHWELLGWMKSPTKRSETFALSSVRAASDREAGKGSEPSESEHVAGI